MCCTSLAEGLLTVLQLHCVAVSFNPDTTLAALAGVDHVDHRAALAKLPPVDGLNMAPWLLGKVENSPRTEVWNDLGVRHNQIPRPF
jgi:hypothetical protein